MNLRHNLDPNVTTLWNDFAANLASRKVLDNRTRRLVLIGQYAMTRNQPLLREAIREALAAKESPTEALEVVLQSAVYGGLNVLDPALETFTKVAEAFGLIDQVRKSSMPPEGRDKQRNIDEERSRWHPDDQKNPRADALAARHGWLGISTGLLVRPKEHLNVLAYIDAMDSDFAQAWERYTYQGLYGRGVLDDKTRILCIVGNCVAMGESIQIRNHMRSALHAGATPREVMEVVFQSCAHFGMPGTMAALGTLYNVIKDEGRLAEIGDPPYPQREHGR